jgi:hypothetical protein
MMGLDSRIGRMETHPRQARSPRRSHAAPGVQPKVGDEPGSGQAGDLVERAGLLEQVSGGQPRGGRIRAGVEQRDPQLIGAEEGGQPR